MNGKNGSGRVKSQAMVDACRELYFKYDGSNLKQIQTEMREASWETFHYQNLLNRTCRGKTHLGWAEKFGWKQELEMRDRAAGRRDARRISTFQRWLDTSEQGLTWKARHHAFICRHLRRVTEGKCRRLMIFVPPRHGKSELVTVRYAAWRMMTEPRMNIIVGSYNQKLANRFSRKVKRLAEGRTEISRRKHGAEEWETAAGGSVKAVGVGAGVTGFGADLIIIDDPVKSRAVANSRSFREKTWDWYKDDIHTRLEPGAAVILIQTRWHDDDLAGRLLKDMEEGGERWEVVRLPALSEPPALAGVQDSAARDIAVSPDAASSLVSGMADSPFAAPPAYAGGSDLFADWRREEGEALWAERFDREALLAIKGRLGSRSFAALYQQRPQPEGGTVFKMEWFQRTVSKAPEGLRWCRGYDLAVSLKDSADYTASFRCAIDDKTGDMYIADGFRKRIEFPEQRRYLLERAEAEPDTRHGIELALHGQALMQDLRREPSIRGRALSGVKVDGDKLLRAEAWAALAEEGKVVLVNGPWISDFLDEVCRFTGRGDAHDDQVDAVSLAYRMTGMGKKGHSF
jgi:predicted phage terminase large subunit-like protein